MSPVERRSVEPEGAVHVTPGRRGESVATPTPAHPRVIAYRKACAATGVGLSHYVLLTSAK
ncbi:MAG: modified peptide precursor CbpA [Acidimicrobiales bacterium]